MMNSNSTTSASPTRHYWFLVLFLVLMSALASFDNDMFTPTLPALTRFFHTTVPTVQLGLTMGMIGLAVGQLILGPLSDRIGRKPVLVGSLIVFIIAAAVCVFSKTVTFFIFCRLIQGIGASGCFFLARSIPADIYCGRPLAKLMALIGGINGAAPASAPMLGGISSEFLGWQSIFVELAIFGVVVLALSFLIKETLPKNRRTVGHWWTMFKGYKVLVKDPHFMVHITFKGLARGILFAYISGAPFILQTYYGLSQMNYGFVIGFNALFLMAGSLTAMHFNPLKNAAVLGTVLVSVGIGAEAAALWFVKSFWLFEGCIVVAIFGLGLILTTTNTLSMVEGRAEAGEASALLGIAGYLVGAIIAPLVGIGNILHSTAVVFIVLVVLTLIFSILSARIACELNNTSSGESKKQG